MKLLKFTISNLDTASKSLMRCPKREEATRVENQA